MTLLVEVIVDRGVNGGKFLQGLYISELRHRSFSSPERLVGILGSIVEPPTANLIGSNADYVHRRSVRPKPVGYNRSRSAVTLHRALQELQRSPAIAALRRENLKHLAFVIYRTPEVMRLAIDPDEHLVQVALKTAALAFATPLGLGAAGIVISSLGGLMNDAGLMQWAQFIEFIKTVRGE